MKIGNDVIEVSRIEKACESESFLKKVFYEDEITYATNSVTKFEHLAGMFAVKESVIKVLEEGLIYDVEIKHKKNGAPYVVLHNKTKEIFESQFKSIEVSISHINDLAFAVAIAY